MRKILVIDDDTYICELLTKYLSTKGFMAESAYTGKSGLEKVLKDKFDLVLCDFRLPDTNGMEILQKINERKQGVAVIIMTAYADIKLAVKLIKLGAFDYVTKPIQHEEIIELINKALQQKKSGGNNFSKDFITGTSNEINEVHDIVKTVAPTDLTVLIQGETGVGKEYIARSIHESSTRKSKPFVSVDCGALPKDLANSELFGHIKGAFTGAISDKKGYFEQANGGTLFLDEIGNLTYENQVKMLRALQEQVINRVGADKLIKVDVRVIVATNEDLLDQVAKNEFREDLYHRINGFKINIPPLRNRVEDIFVFAHSFMNRANAAFNKTIQGFNEDVIELFKQYSWYGNIRELENVVKRSVLLAKKDYITPSELPEEIRFVKLDAQTKSTREETVPPKDNIVLKKATLEAEKEVIINALKKANFNKSKAAKILEIDRKTLYNKINQYEIDLTDLNVTSSN